MNKRKAFTLVELLTVIVIIALLVGILLPSIVMVRRKAKETAQHAQFAAIETALDAFKQDYGDWPPSNGIEPPGTPGREYTGAMKLAEALLGWDLKGFHPKTAWRRDGLDATGGSLTYDPGYSRNNGIDSLTERKGPYLDVATTPAFHIGNTGPGKNDGLYVMPTGTVLNAYNFVICDVFGVRKITITDRGTDIGRTVMAGSPVLYYKANTNSKTITMNPTGPLDTSNIYNHLDNRDLIYLGKLTPTGSASVNHPLVYNGWPPNFPSFYEARFTYIPAAVGPRAQRYGGSGTGYGIKDPKLSGTLGLSFWPYRPDSYILISAGMDGLYGTQDDIHNY